MTRSTGTGTILFTDLERTTQFLHRLGKEMNSCLP